MASWLEVFVEAVARGAEFATVALVAVGASEAAARIVWRMVRPGGTVLTQRRIWMRFASWILLALEFALGADIVRTAVAPSWDDVGQLAAVAAIRTALGWFLGRDLWIETARGAAE